MYINIFIWLTKLLILYKFFNCFKIIEIFPFKFKYIYIFSITLYIINLYTILFFILLVIFCFLINDIFRYINCILKFME